MVGQFFSMDADRGDASPFPSPPGGPLVPAHSQAGHSATPTLAEASFVPLEDFAARDDEAAQLKASAGITLLTMVSRISGLGRIILVSGILGTTFLGATYATANALPNLVFELVAAGALSSVFVPTLVGYLRQGDKEGAERVAGGVLGVSLLILGVFCLVGLVAAEPLSRLLFISVRDPAARQAKVELGTYFLLFFLPQVLFYAIAMVATGVLQSYRRFLVPAFAPIWSNVVVIAVYVAFSIFFGSATSISGTRPGGNLLLALGTTAGVAALALPQIPFVRRLGFNLWPRFYLKDRAVWRMLGQGAYAIGYLGFNNLILMVMIILSNPGNGVLPFQVAWAFFLLPYALFAMSLSTAAFPALSDLAHAGHLVQFRRETSRLLNNILYVVVPVAVLYLSLSRPLSVIFEFGNMGPEGRRLLALHLVAFAFAVPSYCAFLALTRISYSLSDTRWPTLANGIGVAAGIALMLVIRVFLTGTPTVLGLGFGVALAYSISCLILAWHERSRIRMRPVVNTLGAVTVAGAVMAALAWFVSQLIMGVGDGGRFIGLLACLGGSVVGIGTYLGLTFAVKLPASNLIKASKLWKLATFKK